MAKLAGRDEVADMPLGAPPALGYLPGHKGAVLVHGLGSEAHSGASSRLAGAVGLGFVTR